MSRIACLPASCCSGLLSVKVRFVWAAMLLPYMHIFCMLDAQQHFQRFSTWWRCRWAELKLVYLSQLCSAHAVLSLFQTLYCFIHRKICCQSVIVDYCVVIIHLKHIFIMNICVRSWLHSLLWLCTFGVCVCNSLVSLLFFVQFCPFPFIYRFVLWLCVIQPKHTQEGKKPTEQRNSDFFFFSTHNSDSHPISYTFYSRLLQRISSLHVSALIRWLARVFYCLAVVE